MFSVSPGKRTASALKKPAPASLSHVPLKVASTRISRRVRGSSFLISTFSTGKIFFSSPVMNLPLSAAASS